MAKVFLDEQNVNRLFAPAQMGFEWLCLLLLQPLILHGKSFCKKGKTPPVRGE
jgi:hypothetical protein